jgi:S1-C subfamily serine protease
MLAICITSLLISLPIQLASNCLAAAIPHTSDPLGNQPSQLSETQITERARLITVKVISGKSWGSGILVQKRGKFYAVLTNNHVLQPGKQIKILTSDGRVHQASRYKAANFSNKDLALLQFSSDKPSYTLAILGVSAQIMVGEDVFAAGFPFEEGAKQDKGFQFTSGKVALVSDQILEEGYQIGYTNKIVVGMSGGPVLNSWGELVAINGMHAYPLWGDPYIYENGEQPCLPLRQRMRELSWSIPVDTFAQLAPPGIIPTVADSHQAVSSESTAWNISNAMNGFKSYFPYSILIMRLEAEALKKCTPTQVK